MLVLAQVHVDPARKPPPSPSLAAVTRQQFVGARRAASGSTPTMTDCGESGRSIRTIFGAAGAVGGQSPCCRPAPSRPASRRSCASSAALTSASGRSLTTKIVALSGRSQACRNAIRSSRVSVGHRLAVAAAERFGVGRGGAVDQRRDRAAGERVGVGQFGRDRGQLLALDAARPRSGRRRGCAARRRTGRRPAQVGARARRD